MFVVNELKRYTNEKQKRMLTVNKLSLYFLRLKKKGGNVKGESVFNETG
jgi:hypothetical protein